MVFLAGSLALFLGGGVVFSAANIVAPPCYIVVTLLLAAVLGQLIPAPSRTS